MKRMVTIGLAAMFAFAATALVTAQEGGNAKEATAKGEWTGVVEKTSHNVPRLVANGTHYRLRAAAKAEESVKETLKKIGDGKLTGTYKVTGVTSEEGKLVWVNVETIELSKAGDATLNGDAKKEGDKKERK